MQQTGLAGVVHAPSNATTKCCKSQGGSDLVSWVDHRLAYQLSPISGKGEIGTVLLIMIIINHNFYYNYVIIVIIIL